MKLKITTLLTAFVYIKGNKISDNQVNWGNYKEGNDYNGFMI